MDFTDLSLISFILLVLSIAAQWITSKKISWIFFLGAMGLGYYSEIINIQGMLYIAALGIVMTFYYLQPYERLSKPILGFTIALLGFLLINHYLPGFEKWRAHPKLILTPGSKSFTIYFYLDKAAVAFLLLAIALPLAISWCDWKRILKTAVLYGAIAMAIIIPVSLLTGYVKFEPKLPAVTPLWLFQTFFFACIPEECFFRGFIQKQAAIFLSQSKNGQWTAVIVATVMFSLQNLRSGSWQFVILSVISGLVYGALYKKTDRIEAPIIAHLMVNIVHFTFFTYPSLTVQQFT